MALEFGELARFAVQGL